MGRRVSVGEVGRRRACGEARPPFLHCGSWQSPVPIGVIECVPGGTSGAAAGGDATARVVSIAKPLSDTSRRRGAAVVPTPSAAGGAMQRSEVVPSSDAAVVAAIRNGAYSAR